MATRTGPEEVVEKPEVKQPIPPKLPATVDTVKEKLFDDIHAIIDSLMPDIVGGAKNSMKEELKRKVDSWEKSINKNAAGALNEIQKQVTDAIREIQKDKEAAGKLFLQSLDDWAKATGAGSSVVDGLALLGEPETIDAIKTLINLWKDREKGKHEITVDAPKLIYQLILLISGIVSLVVWIMGMVS